MLEEADGTRRRMERRVKMQIKEGWRLKGGEKGKQGPRKRGNSDKENRERAGSVEGRKKRREVTGTQVGRNRRCVDI